MTTLTQITAAAGQDVPINENFAAVSPSALFSRRYGSGISGLVLGYYGGVFEGLDVANGTITLVASQATIYVVAARATGAVSSSTSTTNWNDAISYFRIGIATTGAATITAFVDKRQAYSTPTAGAVDSVNGQIGIVTLDTDDMPEGATNLYLTAERVQDIVGTFVVAGSNMTITYSDTLNTLTFASSGGGGGLTNWTESLSTASPNGTISAARFIATAAQASVDAVFSPKASGSILAHLPDNSATGGNKRGNQSVDWQLQRGANTQVASGLNSTIGGGQNNTASGDQSCVPGGDSNTASGQYSFAAGRLNTSSSQASYSFGLNNVSSAIASGVMGQLNLADANNALATGVQASTRGIEGAMVRSGGQFSAKGDAQKGDYVLRASTTDATATVLRTNGSAAGTTNQVVLPNTSTFRVRVEVVARSSTNSVGFTGHGVISRGANAAATSVNAAITLTAVGATGGAGTWAATATADTTNGALAITVTGAAATNIKWVAFVETVEVVG